MFARWAKRCSACFIIVTMHWYKLMEDWGVLWNNSNSSRFEHPDARPERRQLLLRLVTLWGGVIATSNDRRLNGWTGNSSNNDTSQVSNWQQLHTNMQTADVVHWHAAEMPRFFFCARRWQHLANMLNDSVRLWEGERVSGWLVVAAT